jgi:hypothetical protein
MNTPKLKSLIKECITEVMSEATMGRRLKGRRRKMFVLVGPPSVGKSTWIKKTFGNKKLYVINRDSIVESVASKYGWTYDDMFAAPPMDAVEGDVDPKYGKVVASPKWMTWQKTVFDKVLEANGKVQSAMNEKVSGAVGSGRDIVVDMTNMNSQSRMGALKAISGYEKDFEKIAVVFEWKGNEELIKSIAIKRAEAAKRMGKSKTIPPAAFDRMFKSFEKVSKSEGFDKIVNVNTISKLKSIR